MDDVAPLLSVLFADVSGSARLYEKLGSAEALRAVDRCLKRVERSIEAFGGRIVKTVGDELMAVFDNADDAFQASLEMLQRVADLPPVSGVKLAIRVGFSHGEVGYESGNFVGEAVDSAAFLAGLAKSGQILTSIQARAALSHALRNATRDLEADAPQGKPPGMTIFEVVAPELSVPESRIASQSGEQKTDDMTGSRFCLRYFGEAVYLDDRSQKINLGRDPKSDVTVHDRRASRHHATIEWRGEKVILKDKSTNGTYVTLRGAPEIVLRRDECVLRGKGIISFASSSSDPEADCAEFELV